MADREPVAIVITPGTIITAIVIVLLVWLALVLKGPLLIVVTSIVLASALEPGVQFFIKRRFKRVFAVTALYALLIGGFLTIAYLFFPPLIQEGRSFIASLPGLVDSPGVTRFLSNSFGQTVVSSPGTPLSHSLLQFENIFLPIGQDTFHTLSGVFGGIASFVLIIVLSFYFAVAETGVDDFIKVAVPVKHQHYALNLWKRSHRKIGLWMQGQLILSVIMGIFTFLWLTILGIPFSLVLSFIAALSELVPIFGPIIAGVAAIAVAASTEPLSTIVLVGIGFLILHQLEGNLIYPLVVKKVVGVPPLLVILALIAGGELAGFLGIVLSVPAAATLQEIFNDIRKKKDHERASLKEA